MIAIIGGMAVVLAASIAWPTFGRAVLDAANVVIIGWLGSYMLVVINKKELANIMRVLIVVTAVGIVAAPVAGVVGSIKEILGGV